jgi:hypothetical protein
VADLGSRGGLGQTTDPDRVAGNVHELALALQIEVIVVRSIGVEIGLCTFNSQLAQKTRMLELMKRIIHGGE